MAGASIRLILMLAGAASALSPLGAQAKDDTAPPDVFILAGQSNMSGRGLLSDLSAAERMPDPAIRSYGNDGQWHDAVEPLDDATGQIDAVSADAQAGVGPGLFFARALRVQEHRAIVLVPCAKGGSEIVQWATGGGRDTLYGSCVARVRAAGGHLAGILWYQGETDAEHPRAVAADWHTQFVAVMQGFRRDLDAAHLPVALVELADAPGPPDGSVKFPSWGLIQRQQARRMLDCSISVSAEGLPLKEDRLHLTTAAQRVVGAKLAGAMDTLIRRGCH
jgi:hypothetical protein